MVEQKSLYQRNPEFIFRRIVDELVLVPIHQEVADMDCIYTMNAIGAFIWEQLENPTRLVDLQDAIMDEYDADPHVASADLLEFVQELEAVGAVEKV